MARAKSATAAKKPAKSRSRASEATAARPKKTKSSKDDAAPSKPAAPGLARITEMVHSYGKYADLNTLCNRYRTRWGVQGGPEANDPVGIAVWMTDAQNGDTHKVAVEMVGYTAQAATAAHMRKLVAAAEKKVAALAMKGSKAENSPEHDRLLHIISLCGEWIGDMTNAASATPEMFSKRMAMIKQFTDEVYGREPAKPAAKPAKKRSASKKAEKKAEPEPSAKKPTKKPTKKAATKPAEKKPTKKPTKKAATKKPATKKAPVKKPAAKKTAPKKRSKK